MGQALYRKYRSRSFDEIVGQEHITKTLQNAIKNGRVSHAYLFTGPRGVGKTSVARILAHMVNDLPYTDESIHLDIIEIDAASNRRIDEIRDLREKVHIAPTSAKYKVYIIDEVHMLTREAFNALLKTLEEPPAHCIFILATTEAHKLPETIISRTQRFEFKPVGPAQTAKHLKSIAKKEKIMARPEALQLLAEHGEGSFRDSIGYLDQLSSVSPVVTEEEVRKILGLPPGQAINDLANQITEGDNQGALKVLDELWENGVAAAAASQLLGRYLRQLLLKNPEANWIIPLLRQLILVPASVRPRDQLEIAVLEACQYNQPLTTEKVKTSEMAAVQVLEQVKQSTSVSQPPTKHQKITDFSLVFWPEVMSGVKKEAPGLYTALRLAKPRQNGDKLILCFQFSLHERKVNHVGHKQLIGRVLEEVSGSRLTIECIVDKELFDGPEVMASKAAAVSDGVPPQTISNIFGKAEVLES
ncbi:MAG: DNA polymerase III subunit gamma/tau [Candidatus Saccharimonadales bacterium]